MTDKQIKEIKEQIRKGIQKVENIRKKYDELRERYKRKEQECEELKEEQAEIKKYLGISHKTILEHLEELTEFRDRDGEEMFQLKEQLDQLKRQHQGDKGLITSTGKMNYQLLQEYDKLKTENDELRQFLSKEPLAIQALQKSYESYQKSTKVFSDWVKDYKQLITEIKEIAKPYQRDIYKICGYCRKYDSCHACCIDDLKYYEYRTGTTKACERFVELERFDINIVANKILQKISECEANQ